jgi:hypothetical protein
MLKSAIQLMQHKTLHIFVSFQHPDVIADVPIHWNSSYLTWYRLLKLKGYIHILEVHLAEKNNQDSKKDSQRLTKVMLTNDEW